jgi:hypothetical protein
MTGVNSQQDMDGDDVAKTNAGMSTGSAAGGPSNVVGSANTQKRKKMLVARPFGTMKGHTAFLTFASAGNKRCPDPNVSDGSSMDA